MTAKMESEKGEMHGEVLNVFAEMMPVEQGVRGVS
jgi:hypothetical protein